MPQSVAGGSGGLKTASGGYFLIPTGPAAGTTVSSSASANTYGSWVEMVASTAAALYIVGVSYDPAAIGTTATYIQVDIGTGAAASETSVGELKARSISASWVADGNVQTWLPYPIPVAASARIACRTADSVASALGHVITLICINQADVVSI